MNRIVRLSDICYETWFLEQEYKNQVSAASGYSVHEMEIARNQMERMDLRFDTRNGTVHTRDRGCCARYVNQSDYKPYENELMVVIWELWSWVRNQASRNRLEKAG